MWVITWRTCDGGRPLYMTDDSPVWWDVDVRYAARFATKAEAQAAKNQLHVNQRLRVEQLREEEHHASV